VAKIAESDEMRANRETRAKLRAEIELKCEEINEAAEGGHIGDFYFSATDTIDRRKQDDFFVIRMLDSDTFYHAVPPEMARVETLMLVHMIETRFFAAGKRCGEEVARRKFREAIGIVGHDEGKRDGE
jgi:hypothetical protein